MLINTCTVLQSSLCSICLFGRKDSIFVTFKERLMEKNLSCWLCVGDISRVFIIKLSAFAKTYHTGLSSVSPQVLLCYAPPGSPGSPEESGEDFGFWYPFNGGHCHCEICITLVHIVTSRSSSLGQQECSISGWPCGRVLDRNPQGCRFDYPKASLCDLGQMP